MRVLVIPEDSQKDQFIQQVLIELAAADSEELSIGSPEKQRGCIWRYSSTTPESISNGRMTMIR